MGRRSTLEREHLPELLDGIEWKASEAAVGNFESADQGSNDQQGAPSTPELPGKQPTRTRTEMALKTSP